MNTTTTFVTVSPKALRRYQALRSDVRTCSGNAVTRSQPGISCGSTSGTNIEGVILGVFRYYPKKRNRFGGAGDIIRLADDGLRFRSRDELNAYALERGYIQESFTSQELRAARISEAAHRPENLSRRMK